MMKSTISCMYYDFLRNFDKKPEGFTIKDIVVWYARYSGEDDYPYEFGLDKILGNWENTDSAARIQAIKIAHDVRKKLASLSERSPGDGMMQDTGERCVDADGDRIEVYESFGFPGNEPKEIIPEKSRRKLTCDGDIYHLVLLSDISIHQARVGSKSKIEKIETYVRNKAKAQRKENKNVIDVLGVGETELDETVLPMAQNILEFEAELLSDLQKLAENHRNKKGGALDKAKEELLRINTEMKALKLRLRKAESQNMLSYPTTKEN